MTIVFQGHVKSLGAASAPIGKLAVTLCTPMDPADGKEWIVFIPEAEAAQWLPGRIVSFTLYTLSPPAKEPS
jgi:hypothetical protein